MATRPKVYRPPGTLDPDARRAQYERERGSARERGYTAEWDKAAREHRREHPFCVNCARRGLLVIATVTDHIVAHRGNVQLFWDRNNWQSLCDPCHSGWKQRLENRESSR